MRTFRLYKTTALTIAYCSVPLVDAAVRYGKKAGKSHQGSIRRNPSRGTYWKGKAGVKNSRGGGASKTSRSARGSRGSGGRGKSYNPYNRSPSLVSSETSSSTTIEEDAIQEHLNTLTESGGSDDQSEAVKQHLNALTESGGSDDPSEIEAQPRANPGDMGFRFQKTECDAEKDGIFPLVADDYPMGGWKADFIRENCYAWSVLKDDDYELRGVDVEDVYIENYLGWPTHCGEEGFWEEFEYVLDVQIQRRQGVPFDQILDMPMPRIWEGHTTDQIAENVHNEYPVKHQSDHLKYIWHDKVHLDYEITPWRSKRDFIGYEVRLAEILTWGVSVVSAINFKVKWTVGRARPEEIAWKIANGELIKDDEMEVPQRIVEKVHSMELTSPENFTSYPEGAPQHPAWPAMHSAGSAIHIWLPVMMTLDWEQYCETLRVDYLVSYARTVAGVHYTSDNTAGLDLGQRIIADALPDHLSEKCGGDYETIKSKTDAFRFRWDDFDATTCEFSGDSEGMRSKLMNLGYIRQS